MAWWQNRCSEFDESNWYWDQKHLCSRGIETTVKRGDAVCITEDPSHAQNDALIVHLQRMGDDVVGENLQNDDAIKMTLSQ